MEQVLSWMQSFGPVAEVLGWLAVLATVVVRMPFLKIDPEKMDGIVGWVMKVLMWLPTIGINPGTQKMMEVIDSYKQK